MIRHWKLIASGLVIGFLATGCKDPGKPTSTTTSTSDPAADVTTPGSSPATPEAVTPTPQAGALKVTKVPRDKLAIGDYMPPLDDDRIEIAKPQGWQALPRDSDFLTRFYETNRNGLPRIEITVEERTYGDSATVTPENVEQFAKAVAAELADLELVEDVIPMVVGGTACARYVGRVDLNLAAGNKISAERQRLLVLQDGRLYTIDLLVLPKTLKRSRNAAYAVCASLRFGRAAEPTAPDSGDLLPE